jgi:hypothetical protein
MDVTIRVMRERLGLSQQGLSDTLGVPKRTIEDWEAGRRRPPQWAGRLVVEKMRSIERRKTMKNFDDFCRLCMSGELRQQPGVGGSHVLIRDDDGQEVFYAEWPLDGIDVDDAGEPTPDGWAEIERQDEEHLALAYAAYIAGEEQYRG